MRSRGRYQEGGREIPDLELDQNLRGFRNGKRNQIESSCPRAADASKRRKLFSWVSFPTECLLCTKYVLGTQETTGELAYWVKGTF